MTLPPPRILFSTSESLPVPLWRGNMTETFLSSGKFLCMALMYRESAFALKIMLEVVALQIAELPPPETPISSTTLRLQALSFGTSLLEPDGTEVHILSGALLSSSYLIVCMFFSHICSAPHPPPFWEGTSRR